MLSDPRDPAGAPPPPGTDTPVPADAASRAAAAGRARRLVATAPAAADRLVPAKALETRAEERARLRRERLALGPAMVPTQAVANPGAGLPPLGMMLPPGLAPAVAESMPQRLAPGEWVQPGSAAGFGRPAHAAGPYGSPAHGHPVYGQPVYGQPAYGQPGYGATSSAPPYGPPVQPQVVMLPPRIRWSKRQRAAAILSSWVGQTIMALATHFLTTFFLIVGFAFLLHVSGDDVAEFEADSFTTVVSLWSTPDRVWATVLIGLLIGGGVLALGWLTSTVWAKSAGLAKPHRSTWLAWLCTTAATGLLGLLVWPMALFGGLFFIVAASSASLTTGSMWTTLFTLLAIAIALTGGVGLLFGWLFLSTSRPRVDFRALAEAEEAEARARDEDELTRVQLRGDPAPR